MKEYYDSGTLKGEFLYENNIRNGISKQYYENGRVKILIPFQYGKALGTAKEYYSDGQIKRESPFVDGLLHGIENWYNKKRNIILIIEYNAGLAVGGEKYEQGAFRSLTKAELNKWDSEESFHF
jgi:antitoxin component YwqK of YwqJK toxin-antitoxin module